MQDLRAPVTARNGRRDGPSRRSTGRMPRIGQPRCRPAGARCAGVGVTVPIEEDGARLHGQVGPGQNVLPDRQGGGADRFSRPAPDCGQPPRVRSPLLASRAEVLRPRPRPIARRRPTRDANGENAQVVITARAIADAAPGATASFARDRPRSTTRRPRMDTLGPAQLAVRAAVTMCHAASPPCTRCGPVKTLAVTARNHPLTRCTPVH